MPLPSDPHNPGTAQEQFLTVLSREEAVRRLEAALFPRPLAVQEMRVADASGLALAHDIAAPIDVPPFDRSGVDGFAVRAADLETASQSTPIRLKLSGETIHCGTTPVNAIQSGMASVIATGAPLPRGADAVMMVEHSQPASGDSVDFLRSARPGQFISYAGSDIARGETLLRAGTLITSREIGMLSACGIARIDVIQKPVVAVISTGDEIIQPGNPLPPSAIYDSNGAIVSAAIAENGGVPVFIGAIPDDERRLEAAMRQALAESDMLILSGGTSKGAGDLNHKIISRLGKPGIIAHGVSLKPGKPLCLAVIEGKPVVILPGFPTSAMFTFHDMIVPILRRMAGLPPRSETEIHARIPVRIASEPGRTEFVMVSLVRGPDGLTAYPIGKGSGAITSFTQADGFLRIEALADHLPEGSNAPVTLFSPNLHLPDLVIVGSQCMGLDIVLGALSRKGLTIRALPVGSLAGLAAAKRGECDLAPIHLLDPATGQYNIPFLTEGLELVQGWKRMQGIAFRRGDARFEGKDPAESMQAALADPFCLMVGRNQGAGTRILLDQLLQGARPEGYWNQPHSHNAVAAAIAQGRADWGLTIAPVAKAADLGFLPLAEEHYDFALVSAHRECRAVRAFLETLGEPGIRAALAKAGFHL